MKNLFKIAFLKLRHPKARILVRNMKCGVYSKMKDVSYYPYGNIILINLKLEYKPLKS